MNNEQRIDQIRQLLRFSYADLESKFFLGVRAPRYHWFGIEREQFLFVFTRRASNPQLDEVLASRIRDIISIFEASNEEVIISNTIDKGLDSIMVYTNAEITVLYGVLVFVHEESDNS